MLPLLWRKSDDSIGKTNVLSVRVSMKTKTGKVASNIT